MTKEFELLARISTVDVKVEAEVRKVRAGRSATGTQLAAMHDWFAQWTRHLLSTYHSSVRDDNQLYRLVQADDMARIVSPNARLALLYRITGLDSPIDHRKGTS